MTLTRSPLDSGWTLRCTDGRAPAGVTDAVVPGQVPGSVHTDLMAAGFIEDPYRDDGERLSAWIGLCEWA